MRQRFANLLKPNAWDLVSLWYWLKTTFPVFAGGGAAAMGIYDQLPTMWIIVGTAVTFASTAIGLLGYRLYIAQRNPEHKLIFVRPLVSRDLGFVRIGIEVRNDAVFPIDIRVQDFRTSCANRITQIPQTIDQFQAAPGETRFLYDPVIDIDGITDLIMIGRIQLTLDYGHPKRMRFSMSRDLNLFIPIDASLPFQHADHLPAQPGE